MQKINLVPSSKICSPAQKPLLSNYLLQVCEIFTIKSFQATQSYLEMCPGVFQITATINHRLLVQEEPYSKNTADLCKRHQSYCKCTTLELQIARLVKRKQSSLSSIYCHNQDLTLHHGHSQGRLIAEMQTSCSRYAFRVYRHLQHCFNSATVQLSVLGNSERVSHFIFQDSQMKQQCPLLLGNLLNVMRLL